MNDFKIILEAMIDTSSLTNAQKQLAKERLKVSADIDFSNFVSEKQKIKQLANEINEILGNSLKPSEALSWANQYWKQMQSGAKQAQREQEKLNQSQKKSSLETQEKYYQKIINNNKTIYSLKEKLLSADERQTKEIQNQIIKLEKRNQYNYGQLNKKGLTDNSWEWEVNTSKEVLESRLRINQEKQKDIALSRQIAKVNEIQLSFDNGQGASDYGNRIKEIENNLVRYGLSVDEASQKTETLRNILSGFKDTDGNFLPDDKLVAQANKLEAEFKAVKISVDEAKLSYDKFLQPVSGEKATSLIVRINSFLTKNTAITAEAKMELQSFVSQLNKGVNLGQWDKFNVRLKEIENEMRQAGRLGKTLTQSLKEGAKSFTQWTISSGAVMNVWNSVRQGIDELKDLDAILTEISKTSDLTEKQLAKLGDTAFESASKYGKTASDYLTGVQEMYRAGFDNAEEMAELSVLAQSAGDMDTNVANDYLMATNAAYKYKGSVEALNKVLDSQNYITNNAAISMQDIADATTETASVAAQYGVQIDELSALIATATANTRESGSEVGTALKSILINLQDTTSKPVKDTFDALGISMTKVVNGAEQLKTPIELIYELADAYNSLPEGDVMRANILNEIGQKRHAKVCVVI